MEPLGFCRPVFLDSPDVDEEPYPDPHQSETGFASNFKKPDPLPDPQHCFRVLNS